MIDNLNLTNATASKLRWMTMIDFMINGGNVHVADTTANWLVSTVGAVGKSRRYNLLARPITG